MPDLSLTNFNIVTAVLGGFITLFGLISYLLKERFYLSEALLSLLTGLTVSDHAIGWIHPLEYAQNDASNLDSITLYFSRLVLGVQLVLAGVQLPAKYLRTEWRPLSILLGPGMTIMWVVASLLMWAMVPHIGILEALALGACITPTDPVLSNSIVKGKFADQNIPKKLQNIIIAESGANDGLGYPFLFLALYLFKYNGLSGGYGGEGIGMAKWFYETWAYTIFLSVAYGFVVGWLAKEALHFAEEKKWVDRESFLIFAIALALFIIGTDGLLGSDDVLACFVAGNAFTWDDWFRVETEDDSLQPTIDLLLNLSIFAWYGAVAPWASFRTNDYIPVWRLIVLAILILLLRRLPMILAFHKQLTEIEGWGQAFIVGFFGPIGVSAVFYLYISLEFLDGIVVDGAVRADAARLADIMRVVIWFMAISSIVVHGLSIPMTKLGYHGPKKISQAWSQDARDSSPKPNPYHLSSNVDYIQRRFGRPGNSGGNQKSENTTPRAESPSQPRSFMLGIRGRNEGEPDRPIEVIDTSDTEAGNGYEPPALVAARSRANDAYEEGYKEGVKEGVRRALAQNEKSEA